MADMAVPVKEIRDGYIIALNLGTPPQTIHVYLDTGSDLTWVPCGALSFDCIDCDDDYRSNKLLAATFSPSLSSSVSRDSCSSPYCIDIHSSDNSFDACTVAGCSLAMLVRSTCYRPCPSFAYTYGGDGIVTGTLARDVLTVLNDIIPNRNSSSTWEIPKFCFGCVGATYREPIGIAGFGKGPLSLPSQLGFLQKGFSHCFLPFRYANNPNISSPLIVGELAIASKDYLQFTPMLKSPMYPNYYYIGLEAVSVSVGGNMAQVVPVPSSLKELDVSGNGGMMIDSGTTYTHLPYPLYSKLLVLLQSVITYPRATQVEERSGFDLCYTSPCPTNKILPDDADDDLPLITFHFLNNASLTLPRGNSFYAMSAPRNLTVVKCLLFQSMGDDIGAGDSSSSSSSLGPAGVLGSFQQQNVEVVYDLEKERIGFHSSDCAQAAIISSTDHHRG
ncbi:probable aspartyl protease At4g16563 [Andrographis paniculata]|uniref:probable aspartyl protease At4g16563 n=1 Tax=Andrographis paniculata TaxID=175694 RepID=UPI0021E78FC3|nr:probable aspartyl protease At4g16563 [Andrographis paniculata]